MPYMLHTMFCDTITMISGNPLVLEVLYFTNFTADMEVIQFVFETMFNKIYVVRSVFYLISPIII